MEQADNYFTPDCTTPGHVTYTHRGMLVWSWWMSVCCLSLSVDPDSVYKGCMSVHPYRGTDTHRSPWVTWLYGAGMTHTQGHFS